MKQTNCILDCESLVAALARQNQPQAAISSKVSSKVQQASDMKGSGNAFLEDLVFKGLGLR